MGSHSHDACRELVQAISSLPKLHAMVIKEPGDNLMDEFRLLTSELTSRH